MEENNQKMVEAHVLINYGTNEKVLLNRLHNIEDVTETRDVSGSYDIITKINANNTKSLMSTRDEIGKIVNINSTIMLIHTDSQNLPNMIDKINLISNKNDNHDSIDYDYTCCDQCGLSLPHCHCACPYCAERDSCECALFDAATGG